jgi:hypothetical protein
VKRLLKDAESHYEVARSADMRPADTLNWEHGQNCQEAADEITHLRNELHIVEVWSARIIAGTQQDITEIARLRAENESLRAALKPFASTKADAGYDYISGLPDIVIIRIEASVREIKAARAALEEK